MQALLLAESIAELRTLHLHFSLDKLTVSRWGYVVREMHPPCNEHSLAPHDSQMLIIMKLNIIVK